ncbi:MAG: NADH-quinone oxidoreductase subunit NuoF [bacterium]|nr:NADH-quinone oxidoreductase subunit NuoF [bacterium]
MVKEILKKYSTAEDNLISILHDVQDSHPEHYLCDKDINEIHRYLNIPIAKIYGVISFYTMFSLKPRGKYIIRVCESVACHVMGSDDLVEVLEKKLGISVGETTKDKLFTLETAACLGVCGMAPAMMINKNVYGNLTEKKIDKILKDLKAKETYVNESEEGDKLLDKENQTQILLNNFGKIDPEKIDAYLKVGGYEGLKKALSMKTSEVIEEVKNSGLRGRGGSGFPTGLKWSFTAPIKGEKFILCNADEGEPGTFKDRPLMEGDPHKVLEGMAIAGYAIGAEKGFIYIRGEYYRSIDRVRKAIKQAEEKGLLGEKINKSDFNFKIEVRIGAGAYVVGEETALIESLEGHRGNSRVKPPFPGQKGIWQVPTIVNNVETFANVPGIIKNGAKWFKGYGTEKSPGTKIFVLSGKVKNPGVVEAPMGVTLKDLIFKFAGGMKDGKKFKAALLGGAAGAFVNEKMLDLKMDYDNLMANGAVLGSGAIMVMDEDDCLFDILKNQMEFFCHESCGQCLPCRVGNAAILKLLKNIEKKKNLTGKEWDVIIQTAKTMKETSLCALGQSPILPISSLLKNFEKEIKKEAK